MQRGWASRSARDSSAPACRGSYIALETFGGMPAPLALRGDRRASSRSCRSIRCSPGGSSSAGRRETASVAPARRGERVRARRMAARLPVHRISLARRRLFAAARARWRARSPASRRSAACGWCRSRSRSSLRWSFTRSMQSRPVDGAPSLACAIGAAAIGGCGAMLRGIEWTSASGAPLPVSLVQGNVAQDLKFDAGVPRADVRALPQARANSHADG